jgi:hypothetical protein
MKRLEAKYAPLHLVPLIERLGTPQVQTLYHGPRGSQEGEFGVQPPHFTDRETKAHRREKCVQYHRAGEAGMSFPLEVVSFFSTQCRELC